MNIRKLLVALFLILASLSFASDAVHAQTDPNTPLSVPAGGSCVATSDCSQSGSGGSLFCLPAVGGSGSTCQTTAAYTQSSNAASQNQTQGSTIGNTGTSQSSGTTLGNTSTGNALLNPLNATSLTGLLQEILSYAVMLGSIFLTLMLVYVGFLFVSAQGSDEKIRTARTALMWTVVGGLLLLGASALASVITATVQGL